MVTTGATGCLRNIGQVHITSAMAITLYNTLTASKEAFEPLEPGHARIYVCGPTVYDSAHVGHAMSTLVFDIIRRYLEYRGYEVKHVMNYTDVDDKIIQRSMYEEIEAVEQAEGVQLQEGDIMVFRTGHHRRRLDLGAWDPGYTGQGRAGLDPYSLVLLHERGVSVFLPDGDGEVVPSNVEGIQYPIHPLQITAMGMVCVDSLQLEDLAKACDEEGRFEFMVVLAPSPLPGGTGSLINPIAIFQTRIAKFLALI